MTKLIYRTIHKLFKTFDEYWIIICTFAGMKKSCRIILLLYLFLSVSYVEAQTGKAQGINPEDRQVDMNNPTFVPMVKVGKVLLGGDSVQYVELNNIYVYPKPVFSSERQMQAYNRMVYNVKKVLPIAKECRAIILETYDYLQTLPDKAARDRHLKLVEKGIKAEYTPRMKRLTYQQGKLLIKLIYRECNSSSYNLIQSFFGPTRAGVYQAFAWVFGASLRKGYEPEGVDRFTERIVRQVESGQI